MTRNKCILNVSNSSKCNGMLALIRFSDTIYLVVPKRVFHCCLYVPGYLPLPHRLKDHPNPLMKLYKPRVQQKGFHGITKNMSGRKNRALQVPPVVPYKASENSPKALYGTTEGTCSTRFSRHVMITFKRRLTVEFADFFRR